MSNSSIYTNYEQKFQKNFKQLKVKYLRWLLIPLNKLKVSPNHLSILGFLSACLLLSHKHFVAAVICQLFFDTLDGALAEYQNSHSNFGSKLDILIDSSFVIITSLYFIFQLPQATLATIVYLSSAKLLNLQIYTLNRAKLKTPLMLRPRLSVYLLQILAISSFIQIDNYNLITNTLNIIVILQILYLLQQKLAKKLKKA